MRRRLVLALVVVGPIALAGAWFAWALSPVGGTGHTAFPVRDGDGWSAAIERLAERKLIRSVVAARIYLAASGTGRRPLHPGQYDLAPSLSTPALLRSLAERNTLLIRITIPEGRNQAWIAKELEDKGICSEAEFAAVCAEPEKVSSTAHFLRNVKTLEGYLFPDTYYFRPKTRPEDVAMVLLATFSRKINEADIPADFDLHRLVTIASMVEMEAKRDDERALIAGVIEGRLKKGMPLQIDATVLYGIGEWKSRVTYRDLEHPSPYNTYRNKGLPPGPICNPGLASLKAAAKPAKTEYLYYVAKPDGSHLFARTFAEHVANRRKIAVERAQ
ncbi:MAG: endolytic transglycosylase MltG [Fimbriimonadia bacterium]